MDIILNVSMDIRYTVCPWTLYRVVCRHYVQFVYGHYVEFVCGHYLEFVYGRYIEFNNDIIDII